MKKIKQRGGKWDDESISPTLRQTRKCLYVIFCEEKTSNIIQCCIGAIG